MAIQIFFDPVTHYIHLHPDLCHLAAEDYDAEDNGTIVVGDIEAENGFDDNDCI